MVALLSTTLKSTFRVAQLYADTTLLLPLTGVVFKPRQAHEVGNAVVCRHGTQAGLLAGEQAQGLQAQTVAYCRLLLGQLLEQAVDDSLQQHTEK